MRTALAFALALALLPLAAPLAVADGNGGCNYDDPCDPDPSQIDCFQPPKGTLACALRIVDGLVP